MNNNNIEVKKISILMSILVKLLNNYEIYCTIACGNSVKFNHLDPMMINNCKFACASAFIIIHALLCYSVVFIYTVMIASYNYRSFKEFIGDIVIHNFKILILFLYLYGAYCELNNVTEKMINELG